MTILYINMYMISINKSQVYDKRELSIHDNRTSVYLISIIK